LCTKIEHLFLSGGIQTTTVKQQQQQQQQQQQHSQRISDLSIRSNCNSTYLYQYSEVLNSLSLYGTLSLKENVVWNSQKLWKITSPAIFDKFQRYPWRMLTSIRVPQTTSSEALSPMDRHPGTCLINPRLLFC
jgi:hypothetical protein